MRLHEGKGFWRADKCIMQYRRLVLLGQMPVTSCSGVSSTDSDPVGIGPIFMDKEERDFDTVLLQHDMFRGGSYLGAFLALENLHH
jgi:hypothetical protein